MGPYESSPQGNQNTSLSLLPKCHHPLGSVQRSECHHFSDPVGCHHPPGPMPRSGLLVELCGFYFKEN